MIPVRDGFFKKYPEIPYTPTPLPAAADRTASSVTRRFGHSTTCAPPPSPVTSTRSPRYLSIDSINASRHAAFLLRTRRRYRSYIPLEINSAKVSCSNVAVCRSQSHFAAVNAWTRARGAIRYPIRRAEKTVRENVDINHASFTVQTLQRFERLVAVAKLAIVVIFHNNSIRSLAHLSSANRRANGKIAPVGNWWEG